MDQVAHQNSHGASKLLPIDSDSFARIRESVLEQYFQVISTIDFKSCEVNSTELSSNEIGTIRFILIYKNVLRIQFRVSKLKKSAIMNSGQNE